MKACEFLLALGIIVLSGSLVAASLDSRDLLSALFADRGSEQIGLGIQGLRLFHYLVGGTIITALGGYLLVMKRNETDLIDSISLESRGSVALSSGTMKRLEAAMDSMIKSEEKSDLFREITVANGENSRSNGTKPTLRSENIDVKSADSLINNASSLLTSERLARPRDSAESTSS